MDYSRKRAVELRVNGLFDRILPLIRRSATFLLKEHFSLKLCLLSLALHGQVFENPVVDFKLGIRKDAHQNKIAGNGMFRRLAFLSYLCVIRVEPLNSNAVW